MDTLVVTVGNVKSAAGIDLSDVAAVAAGFGLAIAFSIRSSSYRSPMNVSSMSRSLASYSPMSRSTSPGIRSVASYIWYMCGYIYLHD